MTVHKTLILAFVVSALTGCVTYPTGPSMMALPGNGASFDQFRADDYACQGYAAHASGAISAQAAAQQSGVNSAAVGTAVGAIAGAAIGAASGNAGAGAAIGAGSGLIVGSASGLEGYQVSGGSQQNRYDSTYLQCMYAKGHQVPVSAEFAASQSTVPVYPPVSTASAPVNAAVPPPGTPPPPGY